MKAGVALIIMLWLMAVLTLVMYAFLGEMQVEYALAGGFADEKKAEQLAWSGVDLASVLVEQDLQGWNGLTDPWSHDELQFYEFPLGDGCFTLVHPTYGEEGAPKIRWGLEDEASKINVNTATREVLMLLPRMTEEIANSIIDWRDEDSTAGTNGAESEYYQSLNPPYTCKNQPFDTIEELLLVRGVTSEILYGEDTNLNGRLDPNEDDGDETAPPDGADGRLDPGLFAFVTVVSADANIAADGQPRVNLNTADPQQLRDAGLSDGDVQAVMGYRLTQGPFVSVAQLLTIGMSRDRFKEVADRVTVWEGDKVPGLVNINTAPKGVLMTLPGITEDVAIKIMQYRTVPGADLSNIGWLLDVVEPAVFQQFASVITVRSCQFRIHAVGRVGTPYTAGGNLGEGRPGAFKRMLGVFDRLAEPRPRLVYWKDASKFGMPYSPEDGPQQ